MGVLDSAYPVAACDPNTHGDTDTGGDTDPNSRAHTYADSGADTDTAT